MFHSCTRQNLDNNQFHALMTVHPTIGKFIEINTQACMQGLLNISFKQKILTEKQCQTVEELSKVKIEH